MAQDADGINKVADHLYIQEQIKKFYVDPWPVSTILDVRVHLQGDQSKDSNDAKLSEIKRGIFKMFDTHLNKSKQFTTEDGKQITIQIKFEHVSPMSQYWISRDGHLDMLKSQYVSSKVQDLNMSTPMLNENASVSFLICRPIDFMKLEVSVPK